MECPADECSGDYTKLGSHWRYSPSHRPELSKEQHSVIRGLLMGDGWIVHNYTNAYIACSMIREEYLEHLDVVFGCLGTGVTSIRTAKESAELSRDSGLNEGAKEENYSEMYHWQSRSHPEINQYREWYSSGKKQWPLDVSLTPTTLKHWYCGDGSLHRDDYIQINITNERENKEKIRSMCTESGLPEPASFHEYENGNGRWKCDIRWTQEQSETIFEYMGDPLPGFSYKWI